MPETLTDPPNEPRSLRIQPRKLAIGASLLGLALIAAAGGYMFSLRGQISALNVSLTEQTNLVASTKKTLDEQIDATAQAKKRVDAVLAMSATESSNLKLVVEAFAKQAGACEQVKRELNIPE